MRESNNVVIEQVQPVKGKALVRLLDKSTLSRREFSVVRQYYIPAEDWELGVIEAMGEGDFDPVEIGDMVAVRAISGGVAGADVSRELGERRATHIIVLAEEIVAKVEP